MNCSITDFIRGQIRESTNSSAQCFIITGAPSAGKTSIIKQLEARGCSVIHEAAAKIIFEQKAVGVAEPWNQPDFEDKIVAFQRESLVRSLATKTNQVFVDRSPIDAMSYCLRMKHELTDQIKSTVQEIIDRGLYSQYVFWVDHLGVVENNEIRHEDLEECKVIENQLRSDYEALGFKVILIPKATIEARTEQVVKFATTYSI